MTRHWLSLLIAAMAVMSVPLAILAQEAAPPSSTKEGKPAKVTFPEPKAELSQIRVPAGFKTELFAAEPMVQNPSAFTIDEKGRFYVVEANRRKNGVLDMRNLPGWVEEDLASRSVQDRVAMVKRHVTGKELEAMTAKSDRIRLLEDRDGDGKADYDFVFADGFNRLESGTAAGVLAWRGNVYFTEIPDLWLLRDTTGSGSADFRKSLAWGFGVHYTYSGHDMHGLRVRAGRRIYWSIADRAARVEKDGKVLIDNPDSGAVFRCEPDGSNVELFATGLRNPQELAFDRYGNLFTGDNNSDAGDATRWVYVVEGGDSGWRTPYQYHDYPVSRGVWMSERPWEVNPPVPANYRVPPIANPKISGPAGLTYNPGTGMPSAFDDTFLLVDFRGGASNSGIYALKNTPSGAGFELTEVKEAVGNVLATDVEYGYAGGFYFTSWVAGWDPLGQGRIFHAFDPASAKEPIVAETRKLMNEGMEKRPPEELAKLLGHADMRVRLAAQYELAERSELKTLAAVAEKDDRQIARVHAIWGLGQAGRKEAAKPPFVYSPGPEGYKFDALEPLLPLLTDADREIARRPPGCWGTASTGGAREGFTKALGDKNPRVRYFAAIGVGKIGAGQALPQVLTLLRKNADKDAFLTHAGVMALTGMGADLKQAENDESASVRLAVLLAYRRLGIPPYEFLKDPDPVLVLEAARAINDAPIKGATYALADILEMSPAKLPEPYRTPVMVRSLNANYRVGRANNAEVLAIYAASNDAPEPLRVEALHMLSTWDKPPARDRVSALYRPLEPRDGGIAKAALAPVLGKLLETAPDAVKIAALNAASATGLETTPLFSIVSDAKAFPGLRAAALGAMAQRKDPKTGEAVKLALADPQEPVRLAAIRLQPKQRGGVGALKTFLEKGSPREQQAVLQALGMVGAKHKSATAEADAMLAEAFDRFNSGKLAPEAQLDLLEAAAAHKSGAAADRLKKVEQSRAKEAASDPLAAYRECLIGGDARAGEAIFRDRQDVSCMRLPLGQRRRRQRRPRPRRRQQTRRPRLPHRPRVRPRIHPIPEQKDRPRLRDRHRHHRRRHRGRHPQRRRRKGDPPQRPQRWTGEGREVKDQKPQGRVVGHAGRHRQAAVEAGPEGFGGVPRGVGVRRHHIAKVVAASEQTP